MVVFQDKSILLDESVIHFFTASTELFQNCTLYIPLALLNSFDAKNKHVEHHFSNDFVRFIAAIQKDTTGATLELPCQSTITVWTHDQYDQLPHGLDKNKINDVMLVCALEIQRDDNDLILMTNNPLQKMKAQFLNIKTSDYYVSAQQLIYEKIDTLTKEKKIIDDIDFYEVFELDDATFYPNQYVNILSDHEGENRLMRYDQKRKKLTKATIFSKPSWNILPKNVEQQAALDAMLNKKIDLVILAGKAGTGKTLLALAAALELLSKENEIRKILVSRPIIPLGNDLGYLPGSLDEKMLPWMQPIFDNLSILTMKPSSQKKESASYHQLMEKKLLEIEPLTYIRGRSIQKSLLIVDEAQNLTHHEIKTIITRVGEGSKLILTGDPFQIDNPHLNEYNNGLSYVIKKLRNDHRCAHIFLHQGERSQLAELAANIL